ncbi:hypothetical protein, partial [Bacillus cereus]|uniref:hypothetical protein n=1 Tax=Bacillus cereus TaxID=1396 RepID=UPI001A7EE235
VGSEMCIRDRPTVINIRGAKNGPAFSKASATIEKPAPQDNPKYPWENHALGKANGISKRYITLFVTIPSMASK